MTEPTSNYFVFIAILLLSIFVPAGLFAYVMTTPIRKPKRLTCALMALIACLIFMVWFAMTFADALGGLASALAS